MEVISAIILAIIQGLGEFLPISSSGHLVIAHQVFDLNVGKNDLAFDVALHFGTLLAVLLYYQKKLIKGSKKILSYKLNSKALLKSREFNFLVMLAIATIPGALAGFFLDDLIEQKFRDPKIVVFTLVFYAVLLFLADLFSRKKTQTRTSSEPLGKKLTPLKAFIIGIFQALALIPGTSRSGSTITGGLFLGLNKTQAAEFSFLISIPIIAGAALVKIPQLLNSQIDLKLLLISSFIAFLVGFLAIKYLLKFLKTNNYTVFVIYRVLLAGLVIFWLAA
ncbi:MAG: undecaprenyl-diphosphatase UppP [Candidatus Moranbacteria bacterium]|nr:undecaprenyl-diphosphatase UppP [Candidatus Moranbacteria bacterium]